VILGLRKRGARAIWKKLRSESPMREYQFRILNPHGSCRVIWHELGADDAQAVKSANKISNGEQFEVWRGETCVFRSRIDAAFVRNMRAMQREAGHSGS
jgi:hypothetical protein